MLNLLLTGLQTYRESGLAVPDTITKEVAAFAASSDMLASFLGSETEEADGETVAASHLYTRYQSWCHMNGLRNLSSPQFKQALSKKGYKSKRISSGNTWVGLRMRRAHL